MGEIHPPEHYATAPQEAYSDPKEEAPHYATMPVDADMPAMGEERPQVASRYDDEEREESTYSVREGETPEQQFQEPSDRSGDTYQALDPEAESSDRYTEITGQ